MSRFRGQLLITEKLILEMRSSPIDTGEQSPRSVIKRLANSTHPFLDSKLLDRFTLTPNSAHILRYSSTTFLFLAAESSPRTAYSVNHLNDDTTPDLQADHCQRKW